MVPAAICRRNAIIIMREFKILYRLLKETGAWRILVSYLVFVFFAGFLILVFEPDIHTYGDALWYCYAVISTAGFGDIVVHSLFAKLVSVVVTMYSLLVSAVVTGIYVNFITEVIARRQQDTISHFFEQLEHLPEKSKDELAALSEQVKSFRAGKKKN